MRAALFAALSAWAVVVLVIGCATNPVTGRKELSLISSQQELQIGREGYQAVLREYGGYGDTRINAYVDSLGQRLARVSHQPDLEWRFTVLDDPTVNAFAMPGGYIYITRGILAHLNSEAQLAGVLGHEIGHVTARHSAQRISQQQLVGLGLGIASIVSNTFQRYSGAAQQALGLIFLKYGRDDENQADDLGVQYTTKAGYDPREIPPTYEMLRRVGEQAGQRIPTFLSTHPDPGDRQQRTSELARAAAAGKTGLLVRNRDYVRRLDGMIFGNDPRQGYFDGTRFIHPELGFELIFPSGWRTQNTRSAVLGAAPDQSGIMQLTFVDSKGASPSAYVAELERAGQIVNAEGGRETIGGYAAWVGRASLVRQDRSTAPILLALIQRGGDLVQILGQSTGGGERVIVESMRSFRDIGTAARSVSPKQIEVVTVPRSGPFSTVVGSFGPLAEPVQTLSIINNVEPEETVAQGTLIKVVKTRGR